MAAKTRQEIASEYGVCPKTLNKWLKRAGMQVPRGAIPPYLQKQIYNLLGTPGKVTIDAS